jgi:hypothetical protein
MSTPILRCPPDPVRSGTLASSPPRLTRTWRTWTWTMSRWGTSFRTCVRLLSDMIDVKSDVRSPSTTTLANYHAPPTAKRHATPLLLLLTRSLFSGPVLSVTVTVIVNHLRCLTSTRSDQASAYVSCLMSESRRFSPWARSSICNLRI